MPLSSQSSMDIALPDSPFSRPSPLAVTRATSAPRMLPTSMGKGLPGMWGLIQLHMHIVRCHYLWAWSARHRALCPHPATMKADGSARVNEICHSCIQKFVYLNKRKYVSSGFIWNMWIKTILSLLVWIHPLSTMKIILFVRICWSWGTFPLTSAIQKVPVASR